MFLRDSRLKFKALGQSFQGISGLHYWINKEKLKDHNMEPVGLENTRFWAECAQNSPRTLPTLQILRAHSLGVPKLSRSRPTNFGTTHLGRIQSTLMSFPRVRLMLEHPKVFSWRWLVRYAYLLVVERLLGRELPWLVTMWFALGSGNIMLTPQAYESWGVEREREGSIACEYASHLSNVMTSYRFVANFL